MVAVGGAFPRRAQILLKENLMKLSARNQFPGTILSVKKGPTSTSVKIEIAEGLHITSIITTEAVIELKLKKGTRAVAIIKAPSVMLGVA